MQLIYCSSVLNARQIVTLNINLFVFVVVDIQLQLSPFFPHYSPLPYPPLTSPIQIFPIVLVHGPLFIFLDVTLPRSNRRRGPKSASQLQSRGENASRQQVWDCIIG